MREIAELGRRIEERWSRHERDPETLPDLAAEEVGRAGIEGLARKILDDLLVPERGAARQLSPPGAFGQPGVTLHHGRGFAIDVYFWNHAVSAIHDHPFAGCFTILEGFSIHDRYAFDLRERLGPRVAIGELVPRDLEVLRAGATVRFSRERYPLIHSLIHVPNPTVSLVVRTVRTVDYHRYFPPSLAISFEEPEEPVLRQVELLGWLERAGDPTLPGRLEAFLGGCGFETAFRVLAALHGRVDARPLVEGLRRRYGARVDGILPGIEEAVRRQLDNEFREEFRSDDDRMVATILMCAHRRADVVRLLGEWFPDREPAEVLRGWSGIDRAGDGAREAIDGLLGDAAPSGRFMDTILRPLSRP